MYIVLIQQMKTTAGFQKGVWGLSSQVKKEYITVAVFVKLTDVCDGKHLLFILAGKTHFRAECPCFFVLCGNTAKHTQSNLKRVWQANI